MSMNRKTKTHLLVATAATGLLLLAACGEKPSAPAHVEADEEGSSASVSSSSVSSASANSESKAHVEAGDGHSHAAGEKDGE